MVCEGVVSRGQKGSCRRLVASLLSVYPRAAVDTKSSLLHYGGKEKYNVQLLWVF